MHSYRHLVHISTDRFSEQSLLRFRYYSTSTTLSMSTPEHSDHTDQKEANNRLYEYTGVQALHLSLLFCRVPKTAGSTCATLSMGNRGVIFDDAAGTQEHTSTHVLTLSDLVDPKSRRRQIGVNECAAVCRKGCWMTLGGYDDAVGEISDSLEARTA